MILKTSAIMAAIATLALGLSGVSTGDNNILENTKIIVDEVNVGQLATALELYYLDHDFYPRARNGQELVSILKDEKYIRNQPLDPSVFDYHFLEDGSDYVLKLKTEK